MYSSPDIDQWNQQEKVDQELDKTFKWLNDQLPIEKAIMTLVYAAAQTSSFHSVRATHFVKCKRTQHDLTQLIDGIMVAEAFS